jgi:1-acyl-sn-glycerol-3-phosphate acyltransferase
MSGAPRPSVMDEVDELWQPRSGCGHHCIADDEPAPRVGWPLRIGRLAAVAGVMLAAGASLPVLSLLPAGPRGRLVRRFARGVLRALGIRLERRGAMTDRPVAGGTLVVMNHVSWLDIVVLLAVGRSRLVAKTEVRGWPVVGQVAARIDTIFVDRSRPRCLPGTVGEVRAALAAGQAVTVFPEGTTSCGRTVRRFRPAFFQAAVDTGARVAPLTVRFRLAGAGRTSAAAFIGEDTLLTSVGRIIGLRGLIIGLHYGATIHPVPGATRRELARIAGAAVGASGPMPYRHGSRGAGSGGAVSPDAGSGGAVSPDAGSPGAGSAGAGPADAGSAAVPGPVALPVQPAAPVREPVEPADPLTTPVLLRPAA